MAARRAERLGPPTEENVTTAETQGARSLVAPSTGYTVQELVARMPDHVRQDSQIQSVASDTDNPEADSQYLMMKYMQQVRQRNSGVTDGGESAPGMDGTQAGRGGLTGPSGS